MLDFLMSVARWILWALFGFTSWNLIMVIRFGLNDKEPDAWKALRGNTAGWSVAGAFLLAAYGLL